MKSLAPGRAPAKNSPLILTHSLLFLAALSAFAAIAYAIGWDADHARSSFRTSTLLLLGISGALMLAFAIRLRRTPTTDFVVRKAGPRSWTRALLIGLGWSYFVALAAGPQPGVAYVFLAAMASWICVFSWLWIAAPRVGHLAMQLGNRWWIRSAVAGLFWILAVLAVTEGGLRLFALCKGRSIFRADEMMVAVNSPPTDAREVPSDDAKSTILTGFAPMFRIAVLGGPTQIGIHELCSMLNPRVPGIEVRNFTSAAGPLLGYGAGLATAIDTYHPQLLLVFLSVESDLTRSEPTVSPFDWRGLQVVQAVQAAIGKTAPHAADATVESVRGSSNYRRFLESCSLAVCRKPLEDAVLERWNATLARLDELSQRCEKSATTLGIVLAPAEFQLDPATLQALCRCAECTAEQVDLDLPQRRMEAYAAGHRLACIDLLPYLRASKSLPYCRHSPQWNETGNTIVANAVAQFVMSRYGNQMAATSASR
jgi:hypothetical protein